MISLFYIKSLLQQKCTKSIYDLSIDFLARALPTGKTIFASLISSSHIPMQLRYFYEQVEPKAWMRSSLIDDIVSITLVML